MTVLSYREVSQFWDCSTGPPVSSHWTTTHEALTTTRLFTRSDRSVYSPCQSDLLVLATLIRQWLDLSFLTSGIPIWPFQAEFTIFTDASTHGWGAHMGDSQILGVWPIQNSGSTSVFWSSRRYYWLFNTGSQYYRATKL